MIISKKRCVILLVFLFSKTLPMIIGSDTQEVIFNTIQTALAGDIVARGALLNAGLRIGRVGTGMTYRSCFPVGELSLNSGIVNMQTDMIMHDDTQLISFGNMNGNNHTLFLSRNQQRVPFGDSINFGLTQRIHQGTGDGLVVRSLDWTPDGSFLVVAVVDVVKVYSFNPNFDLAQSILPLTFESELDLGTGVINIIRSHPTQNWIAIGKDTDGTDEIRIYEVLPNGTLSLLDSQSWSENIVAAEWHPTGNYLAIATAGTSDHLHIYPMLMGGAQFDAANVFDYSFTGAEIQHTSLAYNDVGDLLAVGLNETNFHDQVQVLDFITSPSIGVTINSTQNYGNNIDVTCLDWNPVNENILAVGLNPPGRSDKKLSILEHESVMGTLTEIEFIDESSNTDTKSVHWDGTGRVLARGSSVFPQEGEFRVYEYNLLENTFFTLPAYDEEFDEDIFVVRWHPNDSCIALGANEGSLTAPANLSLYCRDRCVTFDDFHIVIANDIELMPTCITFQGECSIDGTGHELTFIEDAEFTIDANSTLTFRNIRLQDVYQANLLLTDATSKIVFENVEVVFAENFLFENGVFDVVRKSIFTGEKTFTYASDGVSTIASRSKFIINQDSIFVYSPPGELSDRIVFQDETSVMNLTNATLTANVLWQMLKGRFFVCGRSIINASVVGGPGIIFGDGAQEAMNMEVHIAPDSTLSVGSGVVQYANV